MIALTNSVLAETLSTEALGGDVLGGAATDKLELQAFQNSKTVQVPDKRGDALNFVANRVVALEESVQLKSPRSRFVKVVSDSLDLDFLGQRALIRYWKPLGEMQNGAQKQNDYLKLFNQLVEENYMDQAKNYLKGDYTIPLLEEEAKNNFHFVRGKILKSDVDLLVEFRLRKTGEQFRIVDIKLDETSLESTYRSSFNRIIRKEGGLEKGFPELIRVMEKRLKELRAGSATRL